MKETLELYIPSIHSGAKQRRRFNSIDRLLVEEYISVPGQCYCQRIPNALYFYLIQFQLFLVLLQSTFN